MKCGIVVLLLCDKDVGILVLWMLLRCCYVMELCVLVLLLPRFHCDGSNANG